MKKLFYLFTLILINSCNSHDSFVFENKLSLKGDEISTNALINPTELIIHDSLLFIKELVKNRDKCLKILNLNDFSFISSVVFLGRGPGEVANPASSVIDIENNIIWYSDWGKYKCFRFPIDSLLVNENYRATQSFKIEKGLMPLMNMFYYPPGFFGFSSFNIQKSLVSFLNMNGEKIDSLNIPNKLFPDLWEGVGYSDNPIIIHYNSGKHKFVIAHRFKNLLSVIDAKGNTIFRLPGKPNISNNQKKLSHSFYLIDSDDKYIYCLYVGGPFSEYDSSQDKVKLFYPTRLLVFDWEGVGKYDIRLDHPLLYFAIDKERKRIIGSTMDFENGLVQYSMEKLYER